MSTRIVVTGTRRRVTSALFTAAGLPMPLTIQRVGNGAVLDFTEDLDKATRSLIVRRCKAPDDDTADLRDQAAVALAALQGFLDTPPPVDAAALEQHVRRLTRIVAALVRIVGRP